MSAKAKLVTALQTKLVALSRAEKAGLASSDMLIERFALQEDIAYVLRGPVPRKTEATRLRRKYNLMVGEFAEAPRVVSAVAPEPPPLTTDTEIKVLPKTQPVVIAGNVEPYRGRDRERLLYDRFCVHCDALLVIELRGGWRCENCTSGEGPSRASGLESLALTVEGGPSLDT